MCDTGNPSQDSVRTCMEGGEGMGGSGGRGNNYAAEAITVL